MTSWHDYFPFGEAISQGQSYNTHGYTGHERDDVTGLDYMLARYNSSGLGRFVSVDPVQRIRVSSANPQRWNRYAYVSNNPMNAIDPNGLDEYEVLVVWGNGTAPNANSLTSTMKSVGNFLSQGGHTAKFEAANPSVQYQRPNAKGTVTDVDVSKVATATKVGDQQPGNKTAVVVMADTVIDQVKKDGQPKDIKASVACPLKTGPLESGQNRVDSGPAGARDEGKTVHR